MNIAPFEYRDMDSFVPGPFDAIRSPEVLTAAKNIWPGKAITVRDNDKTLAIVGIAKCGDCGHCWAYLSDEIRQRAMFLHRHVKRLLPVVSDEQGFKRLRAEVHRDFDAGHRWVERLGFNPIGISKATTGISGRNRAKLMHDRTYIEYEKWL